MSAQVQLRLTLSPKHGGRIAGAVPELGWRAFARPGPDGSGNAGGVRHVRGTRGRRRVRAHIFLTSTLEQKQPYVQAAATLKVRLYTDQPLYQASLDLPASNDVLVQQIGKDQAETARRATAAATRSSNATIC